MNKEILDSLVGSFKFASGFYDKFIETCPDKIWAAPFGKFPVWQNVYHAISCIGFFLGPKDIQPQVQPLYPLAVLLFKEYPATPALKSRLAGYAKQMNAFADNFFATITDSELPKVHAGLTARLNTTFTNAGAVTGLIAHHMYHFGMCDAALRHNGLDGLF